MAAIVVLVVGLVLPAVQKFRVAAGRTGCTNNLRRIGNGWLGYHDVHGHFPPGGGSATDGRADPRLTDPAARAAEWGWPYLILPHIGQGELYRDRDPAVVRGTPVPTYYCPARRDAVAHGGLAKIDYAGNAGTRPDGGNGLVMPTARGGVRLGEVVDGAANTVLASGKRLNPDRLGATDDDADSYATAGWVDFRVYRTAADPPGPDRTRPPQAEVSTMFGGSHPGVFHAVFADGAVRAIRFDVDLTTWRRACVRNDALPACGDDE